MKTPWVVVVAGMLAFGAGAGRGAAPALKDAFREDFLVGAAVNSSHYSGASNAEARIVQAQFNTITPENGLKWMSLQPRPGQFAFRDADRLVEFGQRHGLFVVGHTLVWHAQTPGWVFQDGNGTPATREALLERMREHIHTVVGRYKGRIRGWDVVNEAVGDDGALRPSPWLRILGEDFVAKAFQFAHEADPEAELYYNDYGLESPRKREGALRLVRKLQAAGVKITGVGLQGHYALGTPSAGQIEATIEAFAGLGLQVMITELDVDVLPPPRGFRGADVAARYADNPALNPYPQGLPPEMEQRLARRYAEIFGVFLRHREAVSRVTFWGVSDRSSWLNHFPLRGRTNHPLLFDRAGEPKAAFQAVVDLAAGAPGAGTGRPNVLFCIADDASMHFGAYGCTWVKTPHIDRLARQGLVFLNAYTATAKCAPSRSAILTGRNPWQLEEAANHQSIFPAKFQAFTEALRDAGVHAGGQGKIWGPGIALTAGGEPRDWGLRKAAAGPEGFRRFLAERPPGAPFFFWFGSHNPHRGYKPGSGLAAGKQRADIDRVPGIWPDHDTVRGDLLDYAVEVEAFDAEVGALLAVLDERGETSNTLVVVTSDNGMPFPRSKGHNYDLSNHLPLVACWPGGIAAPGRRIGEFVSFIDFAPTFLELLGARDRASGMAPITGRSFTDLLRGRAAQARDFVILGRERNDVNARPGTAHGLGYPVRAIRRGPWLYLRNFAPDRWPCGDPDLGLKDTDAGPTKQYVEQLGPTNAYWQLAFGRRPAEELFDLSADPDCLRNLAAEPARAADLAALREQLLAELKRQQDPRVLGQGDIFDQYPSAKGAAAAAAPARR